MAQNSTHLALGVLKLPPDHLSFRTLVFLLTGSPCHLEYWLSCSPDHPSQTRFDYILVMLFQGNVLRPQLPVGNYAMLSFIMGILTQAACWFVGGAFSRRGPFLRVCSRCQAFRRAAANAGLPRGASTNLGCLTVKSFTQ